MRVARTQVVVVSLGFVALEVVLALGAVPPAWDAARFVQQSQRLGELGFHRWFVEQLEQPGFPLAVSTAHTLAVCLAVPDRFAWLAAAQASATFFAVLAVLTAWLVIRRQFGRQAARLGWPMFAFLPVIARMGPRALSDSMHLFFFLLAYLLLLQGLLLLGCGGRRLTAMLVFLLAGFMTAVGMLCRAESLILMPAVVLALSILVLRQRRLVPSVLAAAVCYGVGIWLIWGLVLIGWAGLSPKDAAKRFLGKWVANQSPPRLLADCIDPGQLNTILGQTSGPNAFRTTEPGTSIRKPGIANACKNYCQQLARATAFVVGGFALVGIMSVLPQLFAARHLLGTCLFLAYSCVLVAFATREGYLSARYFLPVLPLVGGCAAVGVLQTARYLRRRLHSVVPRWGSAVFLNLSLHRLAGLIAAAIAVGLLVVNLHTRPHADQIAYRQAAEWLWHHRADAGPVLVLDSQGGWTGLYSGLPTVGYEWAKEAFACSRLRFVVVRPIELAQSSARSATLRKLLSQQGTLRAWFPANGSPRFASVLIYQWHSK